MPPQLPPGVRIQQHSPSHRALHATRPFQPGDIIATFSDPLLALPDGTTMRTTCNYCLKVPSPPSPPDARSQQQQQQHNQTSDKKKQDQPPQLRACTACKAAVYCDQACQRAHWKAIHKAECKMFTRIREQAGKEWLPTPVRAVAQVLMRLKGGDKQVLEAFGNEGEGGLRGNVDQFQQYEGAWKDIELQAAAAVVYAGLLEKEETLVQAREVLCKIQTNAFNRSDADTGMGGIFLDPGLAMVNHSCVPNAFIGFDRRTATLRAERPIEEGDEITISYIDYTLPRAQRHEALKQYHFQCECPRCEDDLDVYDICQNAPTLSLNAFSIQPDLEKLRNPSIDRSKVTKSEIEAIYKKWQSLETPDGENEEDKQLKLAKSRWELCRPLVSAGMWAVEPLPATILALATSWQTSYKMIVYALPLLCFLATECDPVKYVAPFTPWRVKALVAIAKVMAVTAEFTASGALATRCAHEGIVGTLATADQVTICEALLRLAVHHGKAGAAAEEWEVLKEAEAMLEDLESLKGRERESGLVRAWAKDPEGDPESAAFVETQVIKKIKTLASFAVEGLEAMLAGKIPVKS